MRNFEELGSCKLRKNTAEKRKEKSKFNLKYSFCCKEGKVGAKIKKNREQFN